MYISLDYPDGLNVITRFLMTGKKEDQSQRRVDDERRERLRERKRERLEDAIVPSGFENREYSHEPRNAGNC